MKKILLSESAKALVLAFVILVSYAGNMAHPINQGD